MKDTRKEVQDNMEAIKEMKDTQKQTQAQISDMKTDLLQEIRSML